MLGPHNPIFTVFIDRYVRSALFLNSFLCSIFLCIEALADQFQNAPGTEKREHNKQFNKGIG